MRLLPNLDRPQLLVSFCNRADDLRNSGLLLLDVILGHTTWLEVGLDTVSGAGICADSKHVYYVSISRSDLSTVVTVLDRRTLDVEHVQPLPEADDGHSIACLDGELVVASTGTDEVLAYRITDGAFTNPKVVWSPTEAKSDAHHINSVAVVDGELLCSAFGPKQDTSWASALDGYIYNITRGERVLSGLRQPHTVLSSDGKLYFCNSALNTVNTVDGEVALASGYTRGLAFGADATLYFGSSVGRRPMGDPTPVDSPGEMLGRCAVVSLSPNGRRAETSMARLGSEIYELLLL